MTGQLHSALAEQHIDQLIADAERHRIARAVSPEHRRPGLVARLAAAFQSHALRHRAVTPERAPAIPATACRAPRHS